MTAAVFSRPDNLGWQTVAVNGVHVGDVRECQELAGWRWRTPAHVSGFAESRLAAAAALVAASRGGAS